MQNEPKSTAIHYKTAENRLAVAKKMPAKFESVRAEAPDTPSGNCPLWFVLKDQCRNSYQQVGERIER